MLPINTDLKNIRAVDAANLEWLTKEGWELICVIQEKSVTAEKEEMPCPGPTPDRSCEHGTYWGNKCCYMIDKPVVGERQVTRYLIGQPADDAAHELHTRLERLQADLREANTERAEAQKKLSEQEKQLAELSEQCTAFHASVEQLQADLTEERVAVKTKAKELSVMEQQIGRLRAEFGEREVRRVLGS